VTLDFGGPSDIGRAVQVQSNGKIVIAGTQLHGYLNGKLLLEYTLAEPVSGKIGVWSKTDSVSYFDDYLVTPES
jgi:hypothetical protein